MSDRVFSMEQKAKLTQIINEGMAVMHEVETLNAGLSDTVPAMPGANKSNVFPTVTVPVSTKVLHYRQQENN